MERRRMIKNLVLSTGVFFIPGTLLSSFKVEKQLNMIIIGDWGHHFLEAYCNSRPYITCTSIGWYENSPFNLKIINNCLIKFSFDRRRPAERISINNTDAIPANILEVFTPNNKYILLSTLMKPHAIFSGRLIYWLQRQNIDFRFLGTTPVFNPGSSEWSLRHFSEFEDDPRVKIVDTNGYVDMLRQTEWNISLIKAFKKIDGKLFDALEGLIKT